MEKDCLSKVYNHTEIESELYAFWEREGFFCPSTDSEKPVYSLVMPPPNVTGVLHMGHALVNILQDILVRYKRMCGFNVCWVPGTDHAGIATQTVVERHLRQSQGKKRTDFSREEFIEHILEWKSNSQNTILSQLKVLGCSCDWSKLSFTMDEHSSRAVRTAFKDFYDKGLIYRGDYLVNWDPLLLTALADDEVEYVDVESFLYYFKYPLANGSGYVSVATTRPETIFGDVAVVVSPDDERYRGLIGEHLKLPFVDRLIPIIGDSRIDPVFGTGAVKVTPAHDKDDYKMARDHGLRLINILNPDGSINALGGDFEGLSREECGIKVIEELRKLNLFEKADPYIKRVGVSYRSNAVIEPYLSKQWFVDVKHFIPILRDAVVSGKIRLYPKESETTYFNWINNLEDWCISRQLWWGHRIPIWYNKSDPSKMICFEGDGVPTEIVNELDLWEQDSDVLDTWFSSGLWPLSCFGWPEDFSCNLEKFYPTSVLVTGSDILFFWVARMILMCTELKELPFRDVFLHGLVYGKSYKKLENDGSVSYVTGEKKYRYDMGLEPVPEDIVCKWEKLSKSKGNVIDPLEVIDTYGCDAMRMTLCLCANRGSQIDLDYRLLEEFKNFSNKIWNGARFIFGHLEDLSVEDLMEGIDESLLDLEDLYIFKTLNVLSESITEGFAGYHFDRVPLLAYNFYKNDLCSNYIELVKPVLFGKIGTEELKKNKKKILTVLLVHALCFMHPITPFITEDLFFKLKDILGFHKNSINNSDNIYLSKAFKILSSPSLMMAPYPSAIISEKLEDPRIFEDFEEAQRLVHVIRKIRGEMNIPPQVYVKLYVVSGSECLGKYFSLAKALAMISEIEYVDALPKGIFCALGVFNEASIAVPVPDFLRDKEMLRLEKEKVRLENMIARLSELLSNNDFLNKADGKLVAEKKTQLEKSKQELNNLSLMLSSFF